jgi:hypothetical protein
MRDSRGGLSSFGASAFSRALLALVLLLGLCGSVFAQTASTPSPASGCGASTAAQSESSGLTSTISAMLTPFVSADSMITGASSSVASGMKTGALALGGILAVTYLLWACLKLIADGSGNYLGLMVEVLVPVVLAVGVINQYSSVISSLQSLAQMGLNPSGGGLTTTIVSYANTIFNAVTQADTVEQQTFSCFSWNTTTIGDLLHALLMEGLMYVVVIISAIGFAELIGIMLIGSVLVGVSVAVGPYFIIAGVTPWTRQMMMRWIEFAMASYCVKSLIMIVIQLITPVLSSATAQMSSATTGGSFPIVGVIILFGILWVTLKVFKGIPLMAGSLMGGGVTKAPSLVDDAKELAMRAAKAAAGSV